MTQSPFSIDDPTAIYLPLSSEAQTQAWQQTERFSTPGRRWHAYLNQICLEGVLTWLRQSYPHVRPWIHSTQYASVWEVVDGSAITLTGHTANPRHQIRIVLIPNATIDTSELRVPQEWVDLPTWVGDYYLAVQIEPDEGWLHIWGFTSHERLKRLGTYDGDDRTYSLPAEALIKDLDVLWDAQQFCADQPTQVALTPLPALPLAQAENLLARLGNPSVQLPQLEVPFTLWGALLDHAGWRQRLYQRRVGLPEAWSVVQWFANGVSQMAQQIGWRQSLQAEFTGARSTETTPTSAPILSRPLTIAGEAYELRLIPQGNTEARIWQFELRKTVTEATIDPQAARIPRGTKLRLLTEDLQPFENNEATATTPVDRLYVVVALEPGEGIVWEVEPTPENYEREILRF